MQTKFELHGNQMPQIVAGMSGGFLTEVGKFGLFVFIAVLLRSRICLMSISRKRIFIVFRHKRIWSGFR